MLGGNGSIIFTLIIVVLETEISATFRLFNALLSLGYGARGGVVVKALRCKPAGRGFHS